MAFVGIDRDGIVSHASTPAGRGSPGLVAAATAPSEALDGTTPCVRVWFSPLTVPLKSKIVAAQ